MSTDNTPYKALIGIFGYHPLDRSAIRIGNDAVEKLEKEVIASLLSKGTIKQTPRSEDEGLYPGDQIYVIFRKRAGIYNILSPELLRSHTGSRTNDFQSILLDYTWLGPLLLEEGLPTPRQTYRDSRVYYCLLVEAERLLPIESESEGESKLDKFKEDIGEIVSQIDISRRTNLVQLTDNETK